MASNEIARRSFISGLVLGATALTVAAQEGPAKGMKNLVTLATTDDIDNLGPGIPAMVTRAMDIPDPDRIGEPIYIQTRSGQMKAIGILNQVTFTRDMFDTTSWEGSGMLVPGLQRGDFTFRGWR
jgi:hypothetical protein